MTVGALIGAYQEDDSGGLRAALPLAGEALIDYQARVLSAAGVSPLVAYVERIPQTLQAAFERLRAEGIAIVAVSDAADAASRFEAGSDVILLADGVAPDLDDVARLVDGGEPVILTVPDDAEHEGFERIDASRRWSGLALLDSGLVGATAAMLGDWDLQSTLLRRSIQAGVMLAPARDGDGRGPFLAEDETAMGDFERRLLQASRGQRDDVVARYLLPIVEETATEKLMETGVRPKLLLWAAVALSALAAFCFSRGWSGPAVALLVLSLPLDLVARRLAMLRLRPIRPGELAQQMIWPASGLALVALGWFEANHGAGWGTLVSAACAAAFGEAMRIERGDTQITGAQWLFSRRLSIVLAIPFIFLGKWPVFLAILLVHAMASFFIVQYSRHGLGQSPTR